MNALRRYLLPGFVFQSVVIAGGYGTGREIAEFFLSRGPLGGLLAMALSTAIWSAVCIVSYEFARVFRAFEYRSFFQKLLGALLGRFRGALHRADDDRAGRDRGSRWIDHGGNLRAPLPGGSRGDPDPGGLPCLRRKPDHRAGLRRLVGGPLPGLPDLLPVVLAQLRSRHPSVLRGRRDRGKLDPGRLRVRGLQPGRPSRRPDHHPPPPEPEGQPSLRGC